MDIVFGNSGSSRILLVDDEALNREIIAEYLEDTDYDLITAEDGYQAWSILEHDAEGIDLVLLDRLIPGLDGLQLLSIMKEHPVLKQIPVILQTAQDDTQDVLEGIRAGAFYHLVKPFTKQLLQSVIKTAINEHEAYASIQNELKKSVCTLSLLKSGTFHFRTLDETQDLALFISKACPNPEQALSGLSEIMINAIEHGNLGISYDEKTALISSGQWREEVEKRLSLPEHSDKFAILEFHKKDNQISIDLTDMGEGFNWQNYLEISIDRIGDNHGRGIAMSKIISFDTIEYHGNGNKVTTTINLKNSTSSSNTEQEQLETA